MAKRKNIVHPDHFKVRGRESQGGDVLADVNRQQFAESKVREKRNDPRDGAQDTTLPPPPSEAVGEGRQTSSKVGKQSSAKKMESTRHNAGPIPATSAVAGAFGNSGGEETPQESPEAEETPGEEE
jgi:hypothetical protein